MNIETISLIIAAFVSASLGIAALMRNFKSRTCLTFALFTLLMFLHDTLCVLEKFESGSRFASPRVHAFVVLLLGPAAVMFFRRVSGLTAPWVKRVLWVYAAMIALCLLFSMERFAELQPWVFVLSHVAFVVAAGAVVWLLAAAERAATLTRETLRLRYALWGAVITVGFFITDALYFIGAGVPPLGTIARVLFILFVFQTFIQKEFLTAEEVVGKLALFGGIAFTLSTIYFVLVSWVGDRSGLFFFNSLIASFVILVLFDPIRKLTAWLTRRLLLHRNSMMEDQIESLALELRGTVEPSQIARLLTRALTRITGAESPCLYVLDRDELNYVPVGEGAETEIYASDPLVEYMSLRRGRPFVLETLETDRDSFYASQPRRFFLDCERTMRKLEADFIIPFAHEARIVGFCAARTGERLVLSNEQLRMFIPFGRRIGSQLKSAQVFRELSHRDKLAAAGEMAAGLAHEIKNPLGAIKGAAQLLTESQGRPIEGREEFLKIIIDETDRLSAVLSEFLEYARPRPGEPTHRCDPMHVIEHTVSLIQRDSGLPVTVRADGDRVPIEADPEALKQVLLNLLMNAAHATAETGRVPEVRVVLRYIREQSPWFSLPNRLPILKKWEGWERISPEGRRPFVEIEVSDNGIGIDPDDVARIFVPFFTTKPKGTGLGLALSQRLIESMGGSINVRPNHPFGVSFVIHLPVRRGRGERERQTELRDSRKNALSEASL